jgi:circadian clock protein KaiC
LLGGGIVRGTSTVLMGPAGTGKSSLAALYATAAAARGDKVAIFAFDEQKDLLIRRADALGMDLSKQVESGRISIVQIDPAEMSPGELACRAQELVETGKAKVIVIDSLNGYLQAMPAERYLYIQLHEMLSYFGQLARCGWRATASATAASSSSGCRSARCPSPRGLARTPRRIRGRACASCSSRTTPTSAR